MADLARYCDMCSRRIGSDDLKSGEALVSADRAVCGACAARLTPEQRGEFRPVGSESKPAERGRVLKRRGSRQDRRSGPAILIVGGAAVLAALVAVAVLVARGPSTSSPSPQPALPSMPTTTPPVAAPAAAERAEPTADTPRETEPGDVEIPRDVEIVTVSPEAGETEDVLLISTARPTGGWTYGNGPEFPGATGRLALDESVPRGRRPALVLQGDFSGGGNYVQAGLNLPPKDIEALSFWVKAPEAQQLTLRLIDSTGQCHQIKLKLEKTARWQKVFLPVREFFKRMGTTSSLDVVARYEKWGGANDGRWHDPGKGLYVLLGRGMFPDGKRGVLWLSGVTLLPKSGPSGVTTVVARTARLDEMLQEGEVDWGFTLGQEFPGAKGALDLAEDQPSKGMYALRMRGDFSGGGAYVAATKSLKDLSAESVSAVRLKMRSGNVKSYSLRLADSTGQWHQKKRIPFTADGEWHEVVIRPEETAGGEHWGGANDGKWHPPAQAVSIVVGKYSTPDGKQVELLLTDVRADVVVQATVKQAAYREGFESGRPLPARWQARGSAEVAAGGAFKGEGSLRLSRTLEKLQTETRAVGAEFPALAGTWQLGGACKSDLYSPDNSYNGTVALEALGPGGAVLERVPVRNQSGKANWQSFSKLVELPPGTAKARFAVELHKTYGSFLVDELSAASVAPAGAAEKRVDRILLATDRLGNMLLPEDRPVLHVTVEAVKPLPASERALIYTVRDYWGAEQAAPARATLQRKGRNRDRFVYAADLDLGPAAMETGKYYEVHVELRREAGEPYREYTGVARLPLAETKKHRPEDVPFTIRNWDSRVREYFFLADRIGIRLIGIWGGWSAKPPYKPHAPGIELCKELGAKWVTGTPGSSIEREGFKSYSEEALRVGMRRFLEAYAEEGMAMMCLGNEPHARDTAHVRELVRGYRALYEAAKEYDPKTFVIGTSVGPDDRYFEAGYHKYLDAYDFHIYESYTNVRESIRAFKKLMRKYGAEKPVFSTELGLNSQGMTRHTVAVELVKKLTVFFAEGGGNVSWFTIQYPDAKGKARGTFGDAHCVFDCKYNRYNPRLDAIAYYNMVNGISVRKFVDEKQYPDGVQSFLFRGPAEPEGARCFQVLWKEGKRKDVFVPLGSAARPVAEAELVRIDGGRTRLRPADGGVTLSVSGEPLLLRYRQPAGGLAKALGEPRIALAAEPEAILKGGSRSFTVTGPGLEAASLRLVAPPSWKAEVRQAGTGRAECTVTAPEETSAREGRLLVQLLGPGGEPSRGRAAGSAVTGELMVPMPITSPLTVSVFPLPASGGERERVELRVGNNGREPKQVRWDVSLTEELAMERGTYPLSEGKPPSAYLQGTSEGRLTLPGRTEKRLRIALADLDPLTLYRVRANVIDSLGRAASCDRLLGGFAAARKAPRSPSIDGNLSEAAWKRAASQAISEERQCYLLGGADVKAFRSGKADLSADLRFLWDESNFYVGVEVTDDVFSGQKSGSALWRQDGLQFLVDPQRQSAAKPGKYDYSIALGQKGPQAWCHLSADSSVRVGAAPGITVAARRGEKGNVTYEIAVPWKYLAPFQPREGADLGLAVILNEDDGEGRKGFMGWFSGVHSKQLDMVGDVILVGPEGGDGR